jgi:3-oxoacyl-[acyl-carrier-protein] synthase-1
MGFPLAITATGMVTGVGLSAPATCAAIRCALDNIQETHFRDSTGEWIMGCEVPLEQPWRGSAKLIKMAAAAIREVMQANPDIVPAETPLILCLAEHNRVGRIIEDDARLFLDLQRELGVEFSNQSLVVSAGHVSAAIAFKHASEMLDLPSNRRVLIAASDTMLAARTLAYYEGKERLLTANNTNGFIPGEAGAALLVESYGEKSGGVLCCEGLGLAIEVAHIDSEEPLRAEGLTSAIKNSLEQAQIAESTLDFKITDIAGDQYSFKESSLAFSRIDRTHRNEFDIWHPADCIGEVGAPIGLIMCSVVKAACEKGYSKGPAVLAHQGNDDGKRSAMIFLWHPETTNG